MLVQGTGAVGLSTIALAKRGGAALVFAIGAPQSRLDLAIRMGADQVIDLDKTSVTDRLELVRQLTDGEGADIVVEAAGSPRAVEEGLAVVRDGGRYVIAGHYTDNGPSSINAHHDINRKHLEIRGCWGSDAGHFLRALRLLERHASAVPWREVGGRTYGLHQLNDALADTEATSRGALVVDPRGQTH